MIKGGVGLPALRMGEGGTVGATGVARGTLYPSIPMTTGWIGTTVRARAVEAEGGVAVGINPSRFRERFDSEPDFHSDVRLALRPGKEIAEVQTAIDALCGRRASPALKRE